MVMDPYEPLASLALAAGAGLLIGLEREQSAAAEAEAGPEALPRRPFGGVRTFTLLSLAGALGGLLSTGMGPWVLIVLLVGTFAMLAISYRADLTVGDRGLTTEVAAVVTVLLGALATADVIQPADHRLIVVISLAVFVTALLSFKPRLHALARKVSRDDLLATLQFIVAAAIVLPLAPNVDYGPLDAFNPYKTVLMVVLIAGISFVGYVAVRVMGASRGMGLTGLLGGLVSSTAITLSMAGRARKDAGIQGGCLLAVVLASTIMYARVLLEVGVVNMALLDDVLIPMSAMLAVGLVATAIIWRASRREEPSTGEIPLTNPFQLTTAIAFGFMFAAVLFVSKLATTYAGDVGVYAAGVLAGLTDVDAITLSMADLAGTTVSEPVAATTILLATASNVLTKGGMAIAVGGWRFGLRVMAAFVAMLVAGAGGIAWLWLAA